MAFDEPLVLRVSGMRPRGPAVEVRFEDCGGTTWPLSVPRGGPTADLALPPGVAPRTAIELTCFAGGQPEYGLPFTVGLVLQDGFQAVSSTGITLLPPRPG